MSARPWLSIVTATYNAAATIGALQDSIEAQNFANFEWIIQDGASSDHTVDMLRARADGTRAVIESAPDAGIYDAFNRALNRARGRYVLFVGADDAFHDSDVLADLSALVAKEPGEPDLILGSVAYPSGATFRSRLGRRTRVLNTVHHQGALYHRRLFDDFRYDITSRIVADYELNLLAHLRGVIPLSVDRVFTVCGPDGVSRTTDEYGLYRDLHTIRRRHLGPVASVAYWAVGVANVTRRRMMKRRQR